MPETVGLEEDGEGKGEIERGTAPRLTPSMQLKREACMLFAATPQLYYRVFSFVHAKRLNEYVGPIPVIPSSC